MGDRGPIPKRDDERVRRNAAEVDTETITVIGPVEVPELGLAKPHPIVKDLYESMKDSAQAKYYEPSDWQYARLTMHLLHDMLTPKRIKGKDGKYSYTRISAMMVTSINQMLTSLLLTEGDRRRVRIEVERKPGGEGGNVIDVADMFRQRLEQATQIAN